MLYYNLTTFYNRKLNPEVKHIEKIQKAYKNKISFEQAAKLAHNVQCEKLAKRLRSWTVLKLKKEIASIRKDLKSDNSGKRFIATLKAENFIQIIKTQYRKQIIVNIIALVSLGLTISGLALALAALFNPLILPGILAFMPLILFWVGFFIGIAKYIFAKGFLDSEGYRFSFSKTIPEPVKNCAKNIATTAGNGFTRIKRCLLPTKNSPPLGIKHQIEHRKTQIRA